MKIVFCSLETLNGLTLGFFRKIYNKNAKNYYIIIAIDPHKTFMISILTFYRILNILKKMMTDYIFLNWLVFHIAAIYDFYQATIKNS